MKRQRGRNRNHKNNNNNHNNNRSLDSNGPDVKVRGTAATIYEKYTTLARDAKTSGSRVKAENYRQHAEHYLRLVNIQEAAKQAAQAAREEAEAARQAARNEAGETEDENRSENRTRRNNKNTRGRQRRESEDRENQSAAKNDSQKPDDPVAETSNSDAKQAEASEPAALELVDPNSAAADDAVTQETPKRRRKAPARQKSTAKVNDIIDDAETTEAAQ